MKLFRISKAQFINDLSGTGARVVGGRWNSKGVSMLYTANSTALAILEVLVHTGSMTIPSELKLLELYVPRNIKPEKIKISSLPENWLDYPAPIALAEIGDKWISNNSSLLLKVPSVVSKGKDFNILINPNHPDIKFVEKKSISEFAFDERLFLKRT
jgi:RES domain-containing protein